MLVYTGCILSNDIALVYNTCSLGIEKYNMEDVKRMCESRKIMYGQIPSFCIKDKFIYLPHRSGVSIWYRGVFLTVATVGDGSVIIDDTDMIVEDTEELSVIAVSGMKFALNMSNGIPMSYDKAKRYTVLM